MIWLSFQREDFQVPAISFVSFPQAEEVTALRPPAMHNLPSLTTGRMLQRHGSKAKPAGAGGPVILSQGFT